MGFPFSTSQAHYSPRWKCVFNKRWFVPNETIYTPKYGYNKDE